MKFFVRMDFGILGCSGTELIEASSFSDAEKIAYDMTVDWAESYGYEQNESVFGDLDTLGFEWSEEEEEYLSEGFIDPSVEEYDPQVHDGELY